ncbi:MAG: hypothetical protein GX620_00365 [Chloroflexi bacterium]|nr:hypothetical protein [Chloroflexota bacterium]
MRKAGSVTRRALLVLVVAGLIAHSFMGAVYAGEVAPAFVTGPTGLSATQHSVTASSATLLPSWYTASLSSIEDQRDLDPMVRSKGRVGMVSRRIASPLSIEAEPASAILAQDGDVSYIIISPTVASIAAGVDISYSAMSFDSLGASLEDVTISTTFEIVEVGAGGQWDANVYTSQYAGVWTVRGHYSGLVHTATLTVAHGSAASITLHPSSATIIAGASQAYTATAVDTLGNPFDVTGLTSFSIPATGEGGSWSANVFTSQYIGVWTVQGQYGGLQDTAVLTVAPATATGLTISPATATVAAGGRVTYTATAVDTFGNPFDVTGLTSFSIPATGEGGSWSANVFTSQYIGVWTVQGQYGGLQDTAVLTVTPGNAVVLTVNPGAATIVAGTSRTYTATAADTFGNAFDVTSLTTFSMATPGAGGSWAANVYTSQYAGVWTVRGQYSGLQDTATLTVTHGNAVALTVNPSTATIAAGTSRTYAATAADSFGNAFDVTSLTTFSMVTPGAGGTWSANVYTSQYVGVWMVQGQYAGLQDTAVLTVTPAGATELTVTPATATITAGSRVTYTATAVDTFGNVFDVTSLTNFSVTIGAGGSWAANVYTSQYAGIWTVRGQYGGLQDAAVLTVLHGSATSVALSPKMATVVAGASQGYLATASDAFGNAFDVTSLATFSILETGEGGSWAANVYTSQYAGVWTVRGQYSGLQDTATLTVTPAAATGLTISPAAASVVAGTRMTYTATAVDTFGNAFNVTQLAAFSIPETGEGGSWAANVYTSQYAGVWTVRGQYSGLQDTATLTVTPAAATGLTISPAAASVVAGTRVTYTATAVDSFGNALNVTQLTAFSIPETGEGGSWAANVYTSQYAGVWTVRGQYSGLQDTATLTVTHGSATALTVHPSTATVVAGASQTYTATATDSSGNVFDATNLTTFSIPETGEGGSWAANVYTSQYAGVWTVRGQYSTLQDTAALTVTPGSAVAITVNPGSATITAGASRAYTASAVDTFGNTFDVTGLTAFSIPETGEGGSWAANVYTSQYAGVWTVRGQYSGLQDTATLTVTPASAVGLTVNPGAATITAGSRVTYTVTAVDTFGNVFNVTNETSFGIPASGEGGSWAANVYTSQYAGVWTVQGQYSTLQDTATLTVTPGSAIAITVNPGSATITAGASRAYTASAVDTFGNSYDVTGMTAFSIVTPGAGGAWSANVYTSQYAGVWTVRGQYSSLQDTAVLTVTPATPVMMAVYPDSVTVTAGDRVTYTATATDTFGNGFDVTPLTVFSIPALGEGGSWSANVYTSQYVGTWIVRARYDGLQDAVVLTVLHGNAVSLTLSPKTVTVVAGASQAYVATAVDSSGNYFDVTNLTSYSIPAVGEGGSWFANTYTSQYAGVWTVRGQYSGLQDTAVLTVTPGSAVSLVVSPGGAAVTAGASQIYTARAADVFGNAYDVTGLTAFGIVEAIAGGNWAANVYTSQYAGVWTVRGQYSSVQDTAVLTVTPSGAVAMSIHPDAATVAAGDRVTYTATATDTYGNAFNVTQLTSFNIPETGEGGSWSASVYTSQYAGVWTVRGQYAGFQDTAVLTTTHGAAVRISLTPEQAQVKTGNPQSFVATAYDVYSNTWDVTHQANFDIDAAAAGEWNGSTYTSGNPGQWTVTCEWGGYSDSSRLRVVMYAVYAPIIARRYVLAPDLVVRSITARGSGLTLVIANEGPDSVRDAFWVEAYIDPNPVPTGVNQIWQDRSEQGAVWGVTAPALPIRPGQALTLTVGGMYFWPTLSRLSSPLQAGVPVYAQVDSANVHTTYGAVLETHEILKAAYNNIAGPVYITGMATQSDAIRWPSSNGRRLSADSGLPVRPGY